MTRRVAAIFHTRGDAQRAADALVDLGADREQISTLARGEDGAAAGSAAPGSRPDGVVEPARAVGDSGAPLTTTDGHDAATGAAVGAVAGLAAGLLALTIPGIGLVLAAGPLALAAAGGAIAGGVFGGLRDLGIEEEYARRYEQRVHRGDVLLTALVPTSSEATIRAVLAEFNAEEISFTGDAAAAGVVDTPLT